MSNVFAPFKWSALFDKSIALLTAFGHTVLISVLALAIALVLGLLFGIMSQSRYRVFRIISRIYVELVQNIPLLLQVFLMYAVFPLFGLMMSSFFIGVIGIGFYPS